MKRKRLGKMGKMRWVEKGNEGEGWDGLDDCEGWEKCENDKGKDVKKGWPALHCAARLLQFAAAGGSSNWPSSRRLSLTVLVCSWPIGSDILILQLAVTDSVGMFMAYRFRYPYSAIGCHWQCWYVHGGSYSAWKPVVLIWCKGWKIIVLWRFNVYGSNIVWSSPAYW